MELLGEQLMLLALDPERGTISVPSRTALKYALAGAALTEMLIRGAATMDGRRVVPGLRTGDGMLDDALSVVRSSRRPRDLRHWVKVLGGSRNLRDYLLDRLVARGVLERRHRRVLGLFRVTRYEVLDHGPRAAVVATVREAVIGERDDLPWTVVSLVALASVCDLVDRAVEPERLRAARRRAKAIAERDEGGRAVYRVIRELQTRTIGAVASAAAGG